MNDSMTLCGPPPRKGRRRSLFPICMTAARPEFDTLPVMKVTQYPLEPRDYKPFAQRLCMYLVLFRLTGLMLILVDIKKKIGKFEK